MQDKRVFRVGVAGLDPRDGRLIEIVFRHSQYNKYEYRLAPGDDPAAYDILIANAAHADGARALAQARAAGGAVPVIAAVPRGTPSVARHAISIDRLTLQLLPILNRVVELELGGRAETGTAAAPADTAPPAAVPANPVAATRAMPPPPAALPAARAAPPPQFVPPADRASPPPPPAVRPSAPDAESHAARIPAPAPQAAPAAAAPPPRTPRAAPAAASNLVAFPRSPAGEGAIVQPLRVLVVDDSPTVRRQLTVAFDRMGIACEPVASAAQALQRLADEHFDLALIDVVMPDMDGYRLTREIRRDRRTRQLPVIILTSRSSPFDLARGALAGCDTYLTKPVPFRALEAAVVKQLRKALAIDDLTGLVRTSAPPAATPAATPASRLAQLLGRRAAGGRDDG